MKILLLLLLIFLYGIPSHGQVCGPLDYSFGTQGKAFGVISGFDIYEASKVILIQSDQKIVQVVRGNNGQGTGFGLIRFSSDGKQDFSFGFQGSTFTLIGTESYITCGVLLAGDKILAGGITYKFNQADFVLARYNKNGVLDTSFGTGGIVVTAVGKYQDYLHDLVVQPDGKIIATGSSDDDRYISAFASVRYLANGSLDNTFGDKGKIITHLGPIIPYFNNQVYNYYSYEYGHNAFVQDDGKIVVAGSSYLPDNCSDYYGSIYCDPIVGLVRYLSNGKLDSTFGINGKTLDHTIRYMSTSAMQHDGKILVSGTGNQNGFITIRFTKNGTIDNDFNHSGVVVSNPDNRGFASPAPASLVLLPDGKIIMAGNYLGDNTNDFVLIRYNSDGSLENTIDLVNPLQFHIEPQGAISQITGAVWKENTLVISANYTDSSTRKAMLVQLKKFTAKPVLTWKSPELIATPGYFRYQWFQNGIPLPGNDTSVLRPAQSGVFRIKVTDMDGCTLVSNEINLLVLNGKEISMGRLRLEYYPNPVSSILNIDVLESDHQKWFAELFDMRGRMLVKQALANKTNKLPVSQLAPGHYQLVLSSSAGKKSVKIVVTR